MDAFLDFLERRAGRALRVVSWYSGAEAGLWYVRDHLDRAAVEDRVAALTERIAAGEWADDDPMLAELGPEQAMVQIRETAVILRFPTGERQGIVVSLDIEAARDLHGFVVECAEKLSDERWPDRRRQTD